MKTRNANLLGRFFTFHDTLCSPFLLSSLLHLYHNVAKSRIFALPQPLPPSITQARHLSRPRVRFPVSCIQTAAGAYRASTHCSYVGSRGPEPIQLPSTPSPPSLFSTPTSL